MIWTDPDSGRPALRRVHDAAGGSAKAQIDDFLEIGNRSLMWTDEAFRNPQKVIAAVNPDIIDVDRDRRVRPHLLERLVRHGFYEKIGNPVPTQ